MLHTRAVTGIAVKAFDARRPDRGHRSRALRSRAGSRSSIEDAPNDPRINQELRAKCRGRVPDLRATVPRRRGDRHAQRDERHQARSGPGGPRHARDALGGALSGGRASGGGRGAHGSGASAGSVPDAVRRAPRSGSFASDDKGRAVEVNPALEEMLGIGAAELVGRAFSTYVVPEQLRRRRRAACGSDIGRARIVRGRGALHQWRGPLGLGAPASRPRACETASTNPARWRWSRTSPSASAPSAS